MFEYSSGKDNPLMSIRRPSGGAGGVARSVVFNEAEGMLLVCLDAEGGSYELYHIPSDSRGGEAGAGECKRGLGTSAVFVARQRFAVLDKNRQILIKNFQNEVTKKCAPPHSTTDYLFGAGTGSLLLRSEERITLFDIQQRKAMAELNTPVVKYVVWSHDMSRVALLSKHGIIIATRKLEQLCMIHETIRIKSGAWDGNDVFYFSTLNHIKYCLTNGDHGIIRTLELPVYISSCSNGTIFCLDREGKVRKLVVDTTECMFKLCLHKREFERVVRIIKQSKLSGHAIIAYLQKKGFPQVALHFVSDEQTRFNLAVECGNIDVALQAAYALDTKDNWHKLGAEALKQGNHQVVEMAYQRTKDMERLSFLYLITGNIEKLRKMLKIAEMRGDIMARFHNSLYLGDVAERVRLLADANQLPLAHMTAVTHNLPELAEAIASQLAANGSPLPAPITSEPKMLYPPLPVLRESNWPLLTVSKGTFDHGLAGDASLPPEIEEAEVGGGWGDDLDLNLSGGEVPTELGEEAAEGEVGGGWETEELDLGDVPLSTPSQLTGFYVAPNPGAAATAVWSRDSPLASVHVAAGSFESGMRMLQRQLGLLDLSPLKPLFLSLAAASHGSLATSLATPSLLSPLCRPTGMPRLALSLPSLVERLKSGYTLVTSGKFNEALDAFTFLIGAIALVVVSSKQGVSEAKELLSICREYISALRLELRRKKTIEHSRQMELAAYFTHANLQASHTMLSLRSAMTAAFKLKLLKSAASFARRLLELNPRPEISTQASQTHTSTSHHTDRTLRTTTPRFHLGSPPHPAPFTSSLLAARYSPSHLLPTSVAAYQARKVIQICEATPTDAFEYRYDERNPFVVCNDSMVPIYRGSALVRCTYCKAAFLPDYKSKL
ncbi:MAG: hypothetical protein SGPRY_008862, partial [Prymnesium sp.]